MKYILIQLLFILFLGNLHLNAQNNKPSFQNLDVFQLEWASSPQISPDGKRIAYIRSGFDIMKDKRHGSIWLVNSDGTGHQKLTSRDINESSPEWSPDGSRIAFTSSSENGSEIYVYWINSGKQARLSQLERSPSGISWSPDGSMIVFSMLVPEAPPFLVKSPNAPKGSKWADAPRVTTRLKYEQDGKGYLEPGFHHYFVIPAEGGSPRQITSGNYFHRGKPQWTPDGKQLVFSSNRNENWEHEFKNSEIYNVNMDDGQTTQLTDRNGPDHSPVVSPNGKSIAYLGYDDKVQTYQTTRVYLMDINGASMREIHTGLDRSLSSISWSADGNGLYFKYDDHGDTKIGYTTLEGKAVEIASNLGGTSIGRPYGGGSYSINKRDQIAYTYSRPDRPADIRIVQKGQEAKIISQLNEDILAYRNLAEIEEIWYKSSIDGFDIQGWIATPPDFDSTKTYPLLVENHGGPISNYGPRFSPEIQLYAADGYVVFYPNPRGSTSYGETFGNLLYHNYPGDDYQDVMDGVDFMIDKGYIHADSLYVTGGSAGGIMTAWMIGKNTRFKAAAVVKPVMNWVSKTLTADNYYGYSFYRYADWPWENIEGYMKYSPVSLVGNIATPTLVMVGMEDMRTPLSEAKQLYSALKLRKIETALVEIPGSSHFISARPSQMITKVDHVLAWFRRYRRE